MKKGKTIWVPPVVIEEVEDIKREDNIFVGAEAFRKLVKYARVGREVNRLRNFGYDWSKKRKLSPIDDSIFPPKKKEKKSLFSLSNL